MGKKCVEWQNVSRPDGKTHRRCKSFQVVEEQDKDVMVADSGSGNLGIVVPEPLAGIGDIQADDVVGPAVGLLAGMGGILIARRWGYKVSAMIPQYSGIAGGILGALMSIPLYWVKDQKTMIQGIVSSVLLGVGVHTLPMIEAATVSGAGGYGLLTAQELGQLPAAQVQDAGAMPRTVSYQADVGAYGQVI